MQDFINGLKAFFTDFFRDGGLTIVRTVAFALLGLVILKIVRIIARRATMKSKLDSAAATFVLSVITVVLYVALVIVVASSLGISTAGIIAAFSAIALAIALALQDSLASLANGVIIIFTKPFKKGDIIVINGKEGYVQDIRLFNTKILTYNNEEVIIPNSDVLSETLVNQSTMPLRRVEMPFYVAYSADAEGVRRRIYEELCADDVIISSPAPSVGLDSFGETAIKCTAYAWAATENYSAAKTRVREIIYSALRGLDAAPSARVIKLMNDAARNGTGEDADE